MKWVLMTLLSIGLMVFLGGATVLFIAGCLAGGLHWLLHFEYYQGFVLSVGAMIAVCLVGNAMATHALAEVPLAFRRLFSPVSEEETEDAEPGDEEPAGSGTRWFAACPCGSNKPFARCCGSRAFKKKS
ncbi:MAG: SEC-C domain-containing protein [Planctomycetota bacterium]